MGVFNHLGSVLPFYVLRSCFGSAGKDVFSNLSNKIFAFNFPAVKDALI